MRLRKEFSFDDETWERLVVGDESRFRWFFRQLT